MAGPPIDDFEDPAPGGGAGEQLVLDLDGFEGPIDVLLMLARQQKVDLARISILQLADQYLAYFAAARRLRLELAADYLVMAAWLAYLKSRLLLPRHEDEDEPSAEDLADALAFQLRRLEAMREAGQRLMARDLLGRDTFARGAAEGIIVIEIPIYALTLYDLIKAYADQKRRNQPAMLTVPPSELFTIEAAVKRLSVMLGQTIRWTVLESFLPSGLVEGLLSRSALAATFAGTLELAREGKLQLRQTHPFGPIYVRQPPGKPS
ncbi:MAG: ScpA family protein [Alphaproteobacteria bacterium]|nr:ScpA family protein [Alphaproteobacteria bacterium]